MVYVLHFHSPAIVFEASVKHVIFKKDREIEEKNYHINPCLLQLLNNSHTKKDVDLNCYFQYTYWYLAFRIPEVLKDYEINSESRIFTEISNQ